MDKFEYRTDVIVAEIVSDVAYPNIPEFDWYTPHWNGWEDKSMRTSLAELGADGWELVCIVEVKATHRETPWNVATFKRRLKQEGHLA